MIRATTMNDLQFITMVPISMKIVLLICNEEPMPKYLIYTYNMQSWKTNENFLVVAPRHIKTRTN